MDGGVWLCFGRFLSQISRTVRYCLFLGRLTPRWRYVDRVGERGVAGEARGETVHLDLQRPRHRQPPLDQGQEALQPIAARPALSGGLAVICGDELAQAGEGLPSRQTISEHSGVR